MYLSLLSMKIYLRMIFILTGLATLWSLYIGAFGDPLANIMTWDLRNSSLAIIPCNLCRYIRMVMYPLWIASAFALLHAEEKPYRTMMTLACIGLWLCIYKYALEMGWWSDWPNFICNGSQAECDVANPLYMWYISLASLGIVINMIVIYCLCILQDYDRKRMLH